MHDYLHIICTGCILIAILFICTTLGKKQMEPLVIQMPPDTDMLLDLPTTFKSKNTYRQLRPVSNISSFEQTTNNEKVLNPENDTTLLPELSGFYK